MLQIFADFGSNVKAILEKVEDDKLKTWALLDMAQMPTFIAGKLAVLGDSAHPFLPHQGQGGGQAIEDGVALAALLPLGTRPDVSERLQLYQQCRYERAHTIQEFTRTAGKDAAELAAEGKKLDSMCSHPPVERAVIVLTIFSDAVPSIQLRARRLGLRKRRAKKTSRVKRLITPFQVSIWLRPSSRSTATTRSASFSIQHSSTSEDTS